MTEFINEFKVKEQVVELQAYSISYDTRLSHETFGHKIAAQVATLLSKQMKTPIASVGNQLVCSTDTHLIDTITITLKLEGKPTDTEVKISKADTIKKSDLRFSDAVKKFLNRKAELILIENKYEQDQRNFYEKKVKPAGSTYGFRQGIQVNAHVSDNGLQTLIIDPVTEVRNKINLRDAMLKELEKRNIKHWRDVTDEQAEEINKQFRTKGDNIRTTYVEQRGDEMTHNRYRFVGFDFKQGLIKDDDPTSPVNFHRKYDRKFEMDQPIVKLIARGGIEIKHIPELLEEVPSLHVMKRYGASGEIQTRSLMPANDRYYMTSALFKPLVQSNLIEQTPTIVNIELYGPVKLTVKGDYIEIKDNRDFQQIFEKRKLLVEPSINTLHLFSTPKDADQARRFVKALLNVFGEFGLPKPEVIEHVDCPDDFVQFPKSVIIAAKDGNYAEKDLVIVVFKPSKDDIGDYMYTQIKSASFESLFPVQFVESPPLAKKNDSQMITDLAHPIFLQVVSKCMGQPYGLQEGFVPTGTIFVGIDRYHDPFKIDAPLVTSVVVFDEFGGYVCSATTMSPDSKTLSKLKPLLEESLDEYVKIRGKKPRLILYFLDTGPGTQEDRLLTESKEIEEVSSKLNAQFAYISANKGTHLRIYTGDPAKTIAAKRVSAFTAVTKMRDSREILVVSTEPIVSHEKKKEFGTPRTVLYRILRNNFSGSQDELKEIIAKSVVWLCKHAWISPAAIRIPAPLYFTNKLSRLSAATGKVIKPDSSRAPLYL